MPGARRIIGSGIAVLVACGLHGTAVAQFTALPPVAADANESACLALAALTLPELSALESDWHETGPAEPALVASLPANLSPDSPPELVAHCRVRGLIAPSIRFELWLPAVENWNGRFLGHGATGHGGDIGYVQLAASLNAAYASAATDSGHRAGDTAWLGDDGLLRDFAYRAVFEMTAKAGVLLARFYGRPADYRYFSGCAQGGRQGLMAAQRFPADYDGIVAGAPSLALVDAELTRLWAARAAAPLPGQGLLSTDLLARVGAATTARCDALDGVPDGILEDPRRCNVDPLSLQCDGGSCLTLAESEAVRAIHAGPRSVGTAGAALPGFAAGSEIGWSFAADGAPDPMTIEFLRRAVDGDQFWDWRRFDFVIDADRARERLSWMLDATASDLSAWRDHGGRLIVYQGWNSTAQSPEATIDWYESVETTHDFGTAAGDLAVRDFARLFMVPGMAQCAGDVVSFDMQRAIEDWVERGLAPDRIEYQRRDGDSERTRPLCPYPEIARYRGTGNSDRSGSFVCSN